MVKSAPTGISSSAGLLPRLVADLFGRIYAAPASAAFAVNVSCVELHEEKLVDLMLPAPLSDTKARPKIQVLRKPVDGLSLNAARSMAVTSAEELWTVIQDAFVRRSMVAEGDNKGNARSSFFAFIVVQLFDELRNTSSCGTLTVVDMADMHPEPAPKAPALCLRAPRQLITVRGRMNQLALATAALLDRGFSAAEGSTRVCLTDSCVVLLPVYLLYTVCRRLRQRQHHPHHAVQGYTTASCTLLYQQDGGSDQSI